MQENPGIILQDKKNYLEWKEYVTILLESKGLDSTISTQQRSQDNQDVFSFIQANEKEKNAKALTILRRHITISLHYLIHGVKYPAEALKIIEEYCIGNKDQFLLNLEDQLNKPSGRFFLEKLKNFNKIYRDFIMLGGVNEEAKIIHKLFVLSPRSMAVSLLQQEILFNDRLNPNQKTKYNEIYGKLLIIAENQQDDYIRRSNAHNRSVLVCFRCNQPGQYKSEFTNPWYCTICKRQGHSAYKCRNNNKKKNDYKNENERNNNNNNNSFANAFMGVLHEDFRILKIEEENLNQVLILDSGASYHVCGSKHAHLLCNIEDLKTPKRVGAA
eukprot:snap_masked-scaffold_26-processed-gene-4.134-mRNA-1 protein AED:1.00 eAED:1.00 QI:0/-1/0/0/-1/1/1/0/328